MLPSPNVSCEYSNTFGAVQCVSGDEMSRAIAAAVNWLRIGVQNRVTLACRERAAQNVHGKRDNRGGSMRCTRHGVHKIPVALAVEMRVSGAMTGETAGKRAGNTNRKISICENAFEFRVP